MTNVFAATSLRRLLEVRSSTGPADSGETRASELLVC